MKLSTVFKLTSALIVTFALALAVGVSGNTAVAHEEEGEQANQSGAVYTYTAQPGDSYTKMARKAVQTYGLKEEVNLSQAGIIYAETNLTRAAGSPELNVGQEVKINESDIHDWVDKAGNLTDDQESAWNAYVRFVDFNTDRVGQSS